MGDLEEEVFLLGFVMVLGSFLLICVVFFFILVLGVGVVGVVGRSRGEDVCFGLGLSWIIFFRFFRGFCILEIVGFFAIFVSRLEV